MRRLLAAALLFLPVPAQAWPLEVASEPIGSFQRFFSPDQFGPFAWRGGLTLSSEKHGFGGFSGLVINGECVNLLAVSDSGNWLSGRLQYEAGLLAGFEAQAMAPLLDDRGQHARNKRWADAESITPLGGGKVGVAFERNVRFGAFDVVKDGLAARFEVLPHPAEINLGRENKEVEAFGLLPDGRYVAAGEQQYDDAGNIRAWAWHSSGDAAAFLLARYDEYNVTDLVVTAEGDVLTLERRFNETSLPGMAIRRFPASAIAPGKVIEPELLLEARAPIYIIDNMEGMALCTRAGETRLTLISDDNFQSSIQNTILLQFAYRR